MAEYNMPQYILREFKVTDARVRWVFFLQKNTFLLSFFMLYESTQLNQTVRSLEHRLRLTDALWICCTVPH